VLELPTRQDNPKGLYVSVDMQDVVAGGGLSLNTTHTGDNRVLLKQLDESSVALSVWSPPYFVGKSYEADWTLEDWKSLLRAVIHEHARVLKPGGFLAINVADILAFADASIPRFQADVVSTKRSGISRAQVLEAKMSNPEMTRYQLADLLGCSEQTIQRRLDHNNVRGGKYKAQTRVMPVAGLIDELALEVGLTLYDRRIWAKDPAWTNSRWHSLSYRAVDDFEHIFIFWKPGITTVDRKRLAPEEWTEWGSRGIWSFASVRSNNDHEAKFPVELPSRLIRLLTEPGDLVLDPFMGSGTTGIAAMRAGRPFIGMELLPHYAQLANKNCALEAERIHETEKD